MPRHIFNEAPDGKADGPEVLFVPVKLVLGFENPGENAVDCFRTGDIGSACFFELEKYTYLLFGYCVYIANDSIYL
jgi:hypothetical protein